MLSVGQFAARTCGGLSRRSFLQLGASVPLMAPFLSTGSWAADRNPGIERAAARAKRVIMVWLWGAPSHLDTFDPKPLAPSEYRGPFAAIPTRTPGLQFTELLPRLANISNLFNIVHSHETSAPGHPDAGTVALTGFPEKPEPTQPNFGAIVAKHRGHGGSLPPFVAVGRGIPRDVVRILDGYGGGKLGRQYDPMLVSCTERGQAEIPSLQLLEDLNPDRLQSRRDLLNILDGAKRKLDGVASADWDRTYDRAYQLLTRPDARQVFDLSGEPVKTRERYGQTAFGQSCLLARRLVAAGVPYVQVNWSQYVEAMTPVADFGWDTHIYNFELLQDRHCPILDRALSALLEDLQQRGMLHDTLVVAMGEFGRSPRINNRASRDHWSRCYSSLWAGAGLTPGRVIGASDKLGNEPITERISPLMVGTTIAQLTGIDTQARAEMDVLNGGEVIHELLL